MPMGPSLVDPHAHQDIHDAARAEMEFGTEILLMSLRGQDAATSMRLAAELLCAWRERVLTHADAEEKDVFPQVLGALPELASEVAALVRDHDLLRHLVDETEQELAREGSVTGAVLGRLQALLHIQRLHALYEEETFLPQVSDVLAQAKRPSEGATEHWPNA